MLTNIGKPDDHTALFQNPSGLGERMIFEQKLSMIDVLTPIGEEPGAAAKMAQLSLGDMYLKYDGVDHGMGWTFSLLVNPLDWLSIGVSYSGNTSARFEGGLSLTPLGVELSKEELNDLFTLMGYKMPHSLRVEMPIPPSISFGVNFTVAPWMEIGLDYRLWLYTLYKRQKIKPIYDETQPGKEPITEETLSKDKNYLLSYEIALGFLFRPIPKYRGVELMTGVAYDQSPVPNKSFSLDNPSMSQIVIGMGVRWQITGHWRASLTYMLINYLKRDVQNSQTNPPTNGRGWGRNHIPGLEVEYVF